MTTLSKDEIMAMVEEAGFEHKNHLKYRGRYNKCTVLEQFEIDCFERFATLCRADLVAENERLKSGESMLKWVELLAERDAFKADAERYRWIKGEDSDPESTLLIGMYDEYGFIVPWADDLDAAIDAAMKRGDA